MIFKAVGLPFPAAHEWDYLKWKSDPTDTDLLPFYQEPYDEIYHFVNKLILDRPLGVYIGYHKPMTYLAAACAISSKPRPLLCSGFIFAGAIMRSSLYQSE